MTKGDVIGMSVFAALTTMIGWFNAEALIQSANNDDWTTETVMRIAAATLVLSLMSWGVGKAVQACVDHNVFK